MCAITAQNKKAQSISYLRWFQIKAKTLPSSSSPYDVRAQVRLTISRAGVLVTG